MGWMSALRTPATASGGYLLLFNCGVYDFAGDGPVHMVRWWQLAALFDG